MPEEKEQPKKEQPKHETQPQKSNAKMVWMIIAIISIIALIGLGVYGYMQMQKTNQKIKDQQAQIDELNNKKKTLEDAAAAAGKAAADAAANAVKNTVSSSSDQDKITSTLKAACSVKFAENPNANIGPGLAVSTIKSISNGYSQVAYRCANAPEGQEAILVKTNDNWVLVAEGIGDFVPQSIRQSYSIPTTLPKY